MPRRAPTERFQDLTEAATAVFIAQGYRRTQMADVAEAMGVAKGTLYLYVESKEALFEVALRHADRPRPIIAPRTLPVRTPSVERTLRYVRDRLGERPASPTLHDALAGPRPGDAAQLERILRELYEAMARNRTSIKLVDRCAADYPELARVWFREGRVALLTQLARYLDAGARKGHFPGVPDTTVAARLVLETLVFWSVHRHWDPSPQPVDSRRAEDTVIRMLVRSLAGDGGHRAGGPGVR